MALADIDPKTLQHFYDQVKAYAQTARRMTFVDLERALPEIRGSHSLQSPHVRKLIFWNGFSEAAAYAIAKLLVDGELVLCAVDVEVYTKQQTWLDLPVITPDVMDMIWKHHTERGLRSLEERAWLPAKIYTQEAFLALVEGEKDPDIGDSNDPFIAAVNPRTLH